MKEKEIVPKKNKVFVKVDEEQSMLGSIIIPEDARDEQNKGTVIAIGDLASSDYDIKVDDRILFHSNSGIRIEVEGLSYIVMKADDIYAVIETK